MMKKIGLVLILAVVMAFSAACDENKGEELFESVVVEEPIIDAAEPDLEDMEQQQTDEYVGNKNTKKFHLDSCHTLPKEKNRIYIVSRAEAINGGFVPCENCLP